MANEPRVLNTGNKGNTETTYVSGGTESANVGNEPRVLGSQPSNSNGTIAGGNGVASATVSTEAREAVQTNDITETEAGESGVASSHVTTEAREAAVSEQENENVNMTNVRAVATGNTNERSLTVTQDYRAGCYERNAESGRGFERSKGEKNVVNTITVEEVKMLIKKYGGNADVYSKAQIDEMLETIREGQYVKVDTTEYPTLEQFLASEGEQGTVYLYPVGNEENNYYQYIWEVSEWVSLGSTRVDMSGYPTLDGNNAFTGTNSFDKLLESSEINDYKWKFGRSGYNFVFERYNGSVLTQRWTLSNSSFFPFNSGDLGNSENKIRDIYTSGKIYFAENNVIYVDSSNRLVLQYNGQDRIKIGSANVGITGRLDPDSDATYNIGRDSVRWKDAYLSGKIKDGTNEFNADNVFNVINASDIVNNTLTQAQYDLITNGKPTLIKGTFLNLLNPFVMPFRTNIGGGTVSRAIYLCYNASGNARTGVMNINNGTLAVSLYVGNTIDVENVDQFNGKRVPAYPSNTGSFYMRCESGNLMWRADGGWDSNSSTELKYNAINVIEINADTTYTLATPANNSYPEYKANITNTDTSNAITITLPSGTVIKGNVTISGNTFEIPADSSVELNLQNGKALVMNWSA